MTTPRTTTTLNVRGINAQHAREIKRGAAARDLTIPQYLGRLLLLHAAVREAAREGNPAAIEMLRVLRLETVTA